MNPAAAADPGNEVMSVTAPLGFRAAGVRGRPQVVG